MPGSWWPWGRGGRGAAWRAEGSGKEIKTEASAGNFPNPVWGHRERAREEQRGSRGEGGGKRALSLRITRGAVLG